MTSDIKQNEDHWQQTTSEFRAYLQRTIELLAHKQEITKVDAPLAPNPPKATSRKQTQVIPEVKHSDPVPIVPADKEQVPLKPASARPYSSPLWVGLGDEDESPGRSNRKTKYKKKAK
jgi:hypothetical protein